MFKRRLPDLHSEQSGITGLETAIILIAFIMVASVFAYVVLSAGLYSSQKAKLAIYAGVDETGSTLKLMGDVIAKMEGGYAQEVYITVSSFTGGQPVDLTDTRGGGNVVVVSYADEYQQIPMMDWTVRKLNYTSSTDNLTDQNELFQMIVDVSSVSDNAATEDAKLGAYHTFTLEVKPPAGATLTIERTLPARVNQMVNLH
ncbi:MAG: hypothetical protein V1780_05795 [Chloroflexota bacterium]